MTTWTCFPRIVKALIGLSLVTFLFGHQGPLRPVAVDPSMALPPGPGAERINRDCLTCHEADLIVQQRLTRAGWNRELDKMVRWGASVKSEDREVMLDYLARHFGDSSVRGGSTTPTLPAGAGVDRVQKNCLTCHEADIMADQSLTRAQWEKELDKMARWGAVFSAEDRTVMVEYLATRFGPERIQ